MNKQIPVIFRKEKDGPLSGWITAVFPTQIASSQEKTFMTYEKIGQHGSGSLTWYNDTIPVTKEEYLSLFNELQEIYSPCELVVVDKIPEESVKLFS